MRSASVCATRRSRRLLLAVPVAVAAVTVGLVVSQSGVNGAEKDDSHFTVAGDGSLPTKKPTLGDTRDPLSTDETGYAIHVASTDDSIPDDATDVRGESGPEFVYSDLSDGDVDAGGRLALVVLYDYTGNKAYHQLVDLKAGAVKRSQSAAHLHPPPSPDEAEAAITIALNAKKSVQLVKDFEELEGVPLVSPEQVHYVAGSWSFDGTTTAGSQCGADRCAQLIVSTSSGVYLDTSDFVIDLSTGSIVSLRAAK